MCGIIAGIGLNIYNILYEGLLQLQNRGYDSAGICILKKKIEVVKKASDEKINALTILKNNKHNFKSATIGLGHTRWATHGSKTDENSHPHLSNDNKFAIVHNGIIENYSILKEKLIQKKYKFYSETDTEVIVNLISYYYNNYNCVEKTIKKVITLLEGTWGIVLVCLDTPNTLYCFRNGSPILISNNEKECLIVSEESGFCNRLNNYFVLDNNDICIVKKSDSKIKITTTNIYKLNARQNNNLTLTPEPYNHWMIKEIFEQTETINRVIKYGSRIHGNKIRLRGLDENIESLKNIENIILLGCGTSLNACNYSLNFFKELCNFNCVISVDGADFNLHDIPKSGKTGIILCSQSGETKDLHRCINIANDNNLTKIGVVNVVNSLIAREVDCGCYVHAGREVAVASTKSFTSQCLLLVLISCWFSNTHYGNDRKEKINKIINDIRNLSNNFNKIFESYNKIKQLTNLFVHNSCFIIGKEKAKFIADEGSLKIKEVSYIHSESYSSSSLKHGPFALLEKNFSVILLCPNDKFISKNLNAYEEIKSRNANIITISNNLDFNNNILIPNNETFNHLLMIIPLQILAYELSIKRNINPDMPRNLAKVVTVE